MDINVVIDMDWLKSATYADMKSVLNASSRYPDKVAALNALFATPEGMQIAHEMINDPDYIPVSQRPVDPAEAEQRAADLRLAEEQAEAARLADEQAAAAAASVVEEPPVVVPPIEEKKKIVVDYQVKDEQGNPIGRPTHIEGWTWEEVSKKQIAAHENAVRYAERVKKNKAKDVETQTEIRQLEASAKQSEQDAATAVDVATKEKDPIKLKEAIQKTAKADRDAELAIQAAKQKGQLIANAWLADHKDDFLQCDANTKLIGEWMAANGLTLTYENLENAYAANETKLVKPQHRPVEEPAAEAPNAPAAAPAAAAAPAPVIPAPAPVAAAPVPATPPASQPVVPAPSPTPVAAPNTPAARRPGVNGSLPPGTLTAARPVVQQTPETTSIDAFKKEVDKMPGKEFRQKVASSKQFRDQLRAAGIPVLQEDQYKASR